MDKIIQREKDFHLIELEGYTPEVSIEKYGAEKYEFIKGDITVRVYTHYRSLIIELDKSGKIAIQKSYYFTELFKGIPLAMLQELVRKLEEKALKLDNEMVELYEEMNKNGTLLKS